MGQVLDFPHQCCKPQLAHRLALGAQILVFTGVRYCRALAPIKRRKAARRKDPKSSGTVIAVREGVDD
jgi:hypothetical protein